MANWITPKTDWSSTDYFNIEDYNRIVNNLLYLKDLAKEVALNFEYYDMVTEKNYYSMFYASEMNAIENNLELLNIKTYNKDIGNKKTYAINGKTPDNSEWNRIESAELLLFNSMYGQISAMQHLAITLGGAKQFGKRVQYASGELIAHRLNFRLGQGNGGII